MLLRRALLSKQVPKTVTIPLLSRFTASNGALPSVNSGCSLTADGLYIPKGGRVEYKLSDLYPKDFNTLMLEMDLMYTNTEWTHGWFDFFTGKEYSFITGVDHNMNPNERFQLFDVVTVGTIPKNTWMRVRIAADFSPGSSILPQCEVVGVDTVLSWESRRLFIEKPAGIRLGHVYRALHDSWKGYARNVKITFD